MPAPAPSAELGRRDLLVSQIASVQKLVRIGRRPAGLHKRRLTSVALASYNQRQSEGRPSAASARTVVAVKTPYLEDGQFDLGAYEEHLTRMVSSSRNLQIFRCPKHQNSQNLYLHVNIVNVWTSG